MIPSFRLEGSGPASLSALELLIYGSVISYILYLASFAVYNLYFHPLHNFPGPTTWIIFPLLRHVAAIRGRLDEQLRKFHEVYGEVVRFSPKELSFITAQAQADIYKNLPKAIRRNGSIAPNIITANDDDHSRFRRSLAPAFSEKALRQQEPLMNIYIDLLIEKLRDVAASGKGADMVKWYNLTTFDLIGDLAFGKSFDGLKDGKYHSWVALIFNVIKVFPFIRLVTEYPLIMGGVMRLMPKKATAARDEHLAHTKSVVMKRINNAALYDRGDFMDSMLRHRGEKDGLTDDELVSNANVLIIAGSETTATLLSGVTYWLLKSPEALSKVTKEVRTAFINEAEINFANATARLPFMLACLEEAFRMYPPVPSGLERYCPPGPPTDISGYRIPEGTLVSFHQSAAYSNSKYFHLSDSYIPERWLPSPPPPFQSDNKVVVKPFSVGARNCIGRNLAYNEMRLILARVLWNFDLQLCEESLRWNEQRSYILWEKPPLMCRLRVR